MKFLVDNQLPISLVAFLNSKGFEAKHVLDLGLDRASDHVIWNAAVTNGWVVVSKDEDFLHIAKMHPKTFQLIWVRLGNCRTETLLSVFERLWTTLESALVVSKEDIVEIR